MSYGRPSVAALLVTRPFDIEEGRPRRDARTRVLGLFRLFKQALIAAEVLAEHPVPRRNHN